MNEREELVLLPRPETDNQEKVILVDHPNGYFKAGTYYKQGKEESKLMRCSDGCLFNTKELGLMFCLGYTILPDDDKQRPHPAFLTIKGICIWGTDNPFIDYRFLKIEPTLV